jgi:hypothetical protein
LATTDDARVHCAVLKIRAVPAHAPLHNASGVLRSEGWLKRPFPQDPTACSTKPSPPPPFQPRRAVLAGFINDLTE